MTKKFTDETVKDLKFKVKELNENVLKYYTKETFRPDGSFRLFAEDFINIQIKDELVSEMISAYNKDKNEFESGKLLFESLKLTPKQASDIGFWTYHNHYTFYKYIAIRWEDLWNENKNNIKPSTYVLNHWIQSNSSQGELINYPISGLWWSFYITVDETREDKYELTKIFFKNQTLRIHQLGTARFARHKPAILGVLEFIKKYENKLNSLEEASRTIIPYVNLLGGIRPLSYFEKDWFIDKLEKRFGYNIVSNQRLMPAVVDTQISINQAKVTQTKTHERPESNILITPKSKAEKQINTNYDCYFCLDAINGNNKVEKEYNSNWDYCIGIYLNNKKQFFIHFYQEGFIKKSLVDLNRIKLMLKNGKEYKNGLNSNYTLSNFSIIKEHVFLGVAFNLINKKYFKIIDAQKAPFGRDNTIFAQASTHIKLINDAQNIRYKVLPYELTSNIDKLIKDPMENYIELNSIKDATALENLKIHWPELFKD